MNIELINFYAADGVLNNGYIVKNNSKKIIISIHGMSSNCFKDRDKYISEGALKNGYDYMAFNNRGSDLVKYIRKNINGEEIKSLGGTSYENPIESYYDIKGAILEVLKLGYNEIYLQGHSLGTTKIVYTYTKLKKEKSELLNHIKGIILLSLVDIPRVLKIYLKDNFEEMVKVAESKNELELMPNGSFIHPISAKTFLSYAKYYEEFDFAQYSDINFEFKELNNIDAPLFMRWGNNNEMIEQSASELVNILNEKISNKKKNINYIDGADHGYTGKEKILAEEIFDFLSKI